MNNKKEAIELMMSIILNRTITDYCRLQQYSIFIQTQLIENITEIWRKLFVKESPSLFPSIEELKKDLNNFMIDDTVEKLPLIIWQSIFTRCYDLYENHLLNICNTLQMFNEYKIKLNDLSGKGIFKSKDYLKKVAELKFPDTSYEWQQIQHFNKIRNIIVHNNCHIEINKADKTLLNFINTKEDISISDNRTVIFNHRFITIVIDTYIEMIEKTKEILCPTEDLLIKHYSIVKKHLI
jgi:hypothetical protein